MLERPCWILRACLYINYKCKQIKLFCAFIYFLTLLYTLYIYMHAQIYRIWIYHYISGFQGGCVYTFEWQNSIFINLLSHFCTSVLHFFLPVLSSDNSLPGNHTAFKTVFLKVTSYNNILTFFFQKRKIQKENRRSLLLFYSHSPWKHLRWPKYVSSPYIKWL